MAGKVNIPKSHLFRAACIWESWVQTNYNYERMMGIPCAFTHLPVVADLYPGEKDKQIELMKRESEFFNVHIEFGSCILGLAISMEEEKANAYHGVEGAQDIPNEFITNIKTSLMGPLAGVGDTIYQGVLIPILLALCTDMTLSGGLENASIWGAVVYAILMFFISYGFNYINFMFGYNAGSAAIMDFLERGILDRLLRGASIMGCMVMGGLIVNYVKVQCGLVIHAAGMDYSIQETLFDAVLPKMLPLLTTLGIYYLLDKKHWTSIKVICLIVVVGVIGGLTTILGA